MSYYPVEVYHPADELLEHRKVILRFETKFHFTLFGTGCHGEIEATRKGSAEKGKRKKDSTKIKIYGAVLFCLVFLFFKASFGPDLCLCANHINQ